LEEFLGRKKNRDQLIDEIFEIFEASSMMIYMDKLPHKLLDAICDTMNLDIKGTTSTRSIVDCIIYGCHSATDSEEEKEVVELNLSKHKPSKISEKCSRDDLIHYFVVNDLKDFLSSKNMVSNGKKSQIVNRVIEYFEDEEAALNKYGIDERKNRRKEKTEKKKQTRERNITKKEEIRLKSQSQSQDISEKDSHKNKQSKKDDEDEFNEEELNDFDSEDKENDKDKENESSEEEKNSKKNRRKTPFEK